MTTLVDNLIAYRIVTMLVKPFVDTDAYKLGIIDAKGKNLIKPSSFTATKQREAYTFLHRLVFNLKKLINKLPGGESKLKSFVAALFLVKEYYEKNDRSTAMIEEKFNRLMQSPVILAEETILVEKIMKEIDEDGAGGGAGGVGGAPTNSTAGVAGTSIASGGPVVKKKDLEKYKRGVPHANPVVGLSRRQVPLS